MSAFKFMLATILAVVLAQPTWAAEPLEYGPTASDPATGGTMIADAVVARPLYLAATALGAAVFVVTLPFSALGGNVKEAGHELVVGPGQGLLTRCLGCAQTVEQANVERAIE